MTSQVIPPIYKLHIWIRQISSMIWRRILVGSQSPVAQLHDIIQIAFGWSDDGPAEGDQPADGAEDPGPRPAPDDGDPPEFHRRPHPGRVRAEVVGDRLSGLMSSRFTRGRAFYRA